MEGVWSICIIQQKNVKGLLYYYRYSNVVVTQSYMWDFILCCQFD